MLLHPAPPNHFEHFDRKIAKKTREGTSFGDCLESGVFVDLCGLCQGLIRPQGVSLLEFQLVHQGIVNDANSQGPQLASNMVSTFL